MTDALYKVCGFDRRDGFIRAGIASRCLISVYRHKSALQPSSLGKIANTEIKSNPWSSIDL